MKSFVEVARKETKQFLLSNCHEGAPGRDVWNTFKRLSSMRCNSAQSVWSRRLQNIVEEIQLACLYPRLDINVTKGFNHLLKAPFCIHPSSCMVCVPFSAVSKFNPSQVPNIAQLLQETNAFDEKTNNHEEADEKSRIKDYKKTGKFKGILVFAEFLRKLENSIKAGQTDENE